jgi:GNAT superfamily N-acetyltransferase
VPRSWRLGSLLTTFVVLALVAACGGTLPPPTRRVVEGDIGDWHFRRYQRTVDVEVFVDENPAIAHTASYAAVQAEKAGRLHEGDVASVFVTEYQRDKGVGAALVRFARRLAQEAGYVVEETSIGGQRVFRVVGHGETWAFWNSGKFVVKVGGRGVERIPAGLVERYGRHYPSKVKDGALDEPLEEAPVETAPAERGQGKKKATGAGAASDEAPDEGVPDDEEEEE